MNTVAHTTFQENINNYLQGSPDDAFGWFAGYRGRFFAEKNLVGDLTDVYQATPGIPEGLKKACSTEDGKQIIMPATYYPWIVLYRKSVWEKNGYEVPKTLDEFKALGDKMKGEGVGLNIRPSGPWRHALPGRHARGSWPQGRFARWLTSTLRS